MAQESIAHDLTDFLPILRFGFPKHWEFSEFTTS